MTRKLALRIVMVVGTLCLGYSAVAQLTPEQETAMHQAFQNTRRYQLGVSSYALTDYNQVISNVFVKFLSAYPETGYRAQIESDIKKWEAERDEVAKGNIKYNNQWHQGDAAKTVLATAQINQLITDGDRQVQAGKYDLAISQFQKALQQRPITQETLNLIETKCEYAFTKWTASVAQSDPDAEIAAHNQRIARLRQQIEESNQQIAEIEKGLALVASAKWVDRKDSPRSFPCRVCGAHQGHWVANGHCVEITLKDAKSMSAKAKVAGFRNTVAKAQDEITKEEAAIAALQSGGNQKVSLQDKIQNLRSQLATEIANVKNLLGIPSKAQTASVDVASVTTKTEAAPQAATTQIVQQVATASPESVQPAEAQSATTPARPSAQETQQTAKQSWWNEYWYLVLIGLVVVYFFVRRL